MDINRVRTLEEVSWAQVRPKIIKVDAKLAGIIDRLNPSSTHPFYVAHYLYGDMIVDKGVFQVPNKNCQLVPLNHASIAKEVKEALGYNKMIPTGVISRNSIETFFFTQEHTTPVSLYSEGELVALWHVLEGNDTFQTGSLWNISSGARTAFMLPKVTDKASYRALKAEFNIHQYPYSLNEHWDLFKQLSQHRSFTEEWSSEIIFFSKSWFENTDDPAFMELMNYFLKQVWDSSLFRRNQFVLDYAFSQLQQIKNLKPNPYLADTAKHLLSIGAGSAPGLTPAISSKALPIKGLQKVFLDVYGLKRYAPSILHTHHIQKNTPVYYSLETPTTTTFSPRSNRLSSKMVDMRELKYIIENLLTELAKNSLKVEETPLLQLAETIQYKFYHSDNDKHGEILNIIELEGSNRIFKTNHLDNSSQYEFPESAPFFRGCISISNTENEI